jgi:hypothetical protein
VIVLETSVVFRVGVALNGGNGIDRRAKRLFGSGDEPVDERRDERGGLTMGEARDDVLRERGDLLSPRLVESGFLCSARRLDLRLALRIGLRSRCRRGLTSGFRLDLGPFLRLCAAVVVIELRKGRELDVVKDAAKVGMFVRSPRAREK